MKVLVATDGSECARKGVEYAARLAIPKKGKLLLLHVVAHDPRIPRDALCFSDCEARDKKFLEDLKEAGKKMLKEESEKINGVGLDVELKVELGDPSEEIVRIANDVGADMIVIGVRGVSKWKKMLLGSVSEEVLNKTNIPVFIVR